MIRRITTALIRTAAAIFFRRIEIAGTENIPAESPVIFAVNHPNALIDPLFLLCFATRRVSFLAKAPLFRMPLIGWFVRAFDSIPVFRKQDVTRVDNRETFAQARALLQRGGAIAIFPEGTTHSDPRLRELKTGAARIALGAAIRVSIVPTGLYYTAKQTFRSSALVWFGKPIAVDPEPVDARGEPAFESVERLTAGIESALAAVTLQADSHAALELIARAERIFSAGEQSDLLHELELRRRFVQGYGWLRAHDPARLTRLESKVAQINAEQLAPAQPIPAAAIARLCLLPLAVAGAILHWPVYRLIGVLAKHFAEKEEEMVATLKIVAGVVLYPLMWIGLAIAGGLFVGIEAGFALLILVPLLGYTAMVTFEALDELIGRLRGLHHRDLRVQQQAIRDEIAAVARELPGGG